MLFLSSATAIAMRGIGKRRRIEFIHRECHVFKETAGIVVLADDAFLVGDTIFGNIDQILRRTLNAHDREKAECYIQMTLVTVTQTTADACANIIGNVLACTYAARRKVAARRLNDLCSQHNRLGNLNGSDRHVCGKRCGVVLVTAKITRNAAAINADAPLTAVKNDFLFDNSDAIKFLSAAHMYTPLKGKFYIKADRHLIKATIELNRIYSYAGPKYVRTLGSDVIRAIDDLLTKLGKIYSNIFKAIFIAARVKDSVSIYTDGFFTT